jgi:predicted nucleic acid-binding Zn ribbon protein
MARCLSNALDVASWESWIGVTQLAEYDYRCEVCSKVKTIKRPIGDDLDRVPYCDGCTIPMARIYTANPVHFKGKGWGGDK